MKKNIDKTLAVKLFKAIIADENKKNNMNVSVSIITLRELLNNEISDSSYVLDRVSNLYKKMLIYIDEISTDARYCSENDSITFVVDKKLLKFKDGKYNDLDIAIIAYHEFFHALDERRLAHFWFDDVSVSEIYFGYFCSIMEDAIFSKKEIMDEYKNNHDGFMIEIQAEMYANARISRDNLSDAEKKRLKKHEKYIKKLFTNYNFDLFFSCFFKCYQEELYNNPIYNRGLFKIIFNNGNFNNINEIIKHPEFSHIDSYLIKNIFKSTAFLKYLISIDYEIDNEIIYYLKDILNQELNEMMASMNGSKKIIHKINVQVNNFDNFIAKQFRTIYESSWYGNRYLQPINLQLSKLLNYTLYIPEIDGDCKLTEFEERYLLLQNAIKKLDLCLLNNSLCNVDGTATRNYGKK